MVSMMLNPDPGSCFLPPTVADEGTTGEIVLENYLSAPGHQVIRMRTSFRYSGALIRRSFHR